MVEADGEGGEHDDKDEVVEDEEKEGTEVVEDLREEVPGRNAGWQG